MYQSADRVVFPARAGVILSLFSLAPSNARFPRTRGGDPAQQKRDHRSWVFPARAGVILHPFVADYQASGFPRTRGGDPDAEGNTHALQVFSPHARG